MPHRLSDPAWLAFQNDIHVEDLGLPPWGAVVQWQNQLVLVYICPGDGTLCRKGEVMLTDVSDMPDIIRNTPATFDANQQTWWYAIPQEAMARIVEVAAETIEGTGRIIQGVSETVGTAAGSLTKPLLENLALPLIVIALVYLVMMSPKR
jgi:hypothetical protein